MTYDLTRFVKAQKEDYRQALAEIRAGRKRSHWIWYIFPQVKGLGKSPKAEYYGIDGLGEARAYMANDLLREHLLEISSALLEIDSDDPTQVMGYPDDLKLRSSMTLFSLATPEYDVFQRVLDKFFSGKKDYRTISLLGIVPE